MVDRKAMDTVTDDYAIPPHVITIDTVLASLAQRGFYDHHIDHDQATVQVLAVTEELGEVARMLRRHEQGVAELDPVALATEAADVAIAAICLLGQCAGEASSRFVSAKIKADEMRGWRHNGEIPG